MKNNYKIVFVHGYTASHLADWYPEITPLLLNEGWRFAIPDLPGDKYPHAQMWLEALEKVIQQNDKPLILVGHSLGTRAILLYLEKYKPKVEKVFLIAAFDNVLENGDRRGGKAYPDFFTHKVEIELVKSLVGKFVVLHSKDDHSIPYSQGKTIAQKLEAKLFTYEDRDHFCEPKNAKEIFRVLKQEIFSD